MFQSTRWLHVRVAHGPIQAPKFESVPLGSVSIFQLPSFIKLTLLDEMARFLQHSTGTRRLLPKTKKRNACIRFLKKPNIFSRFWRTLLVGSWPLTMSRYPASLRSRVTAAGFY